MIFYNLQPNTWGFIISIINNKFKDKYHDSQLQYLKPELVNISQDNFSDALNL